jgi:integrase
MSRPRKDGTAPRETRKAKLGDTVIRSLQAESVPYLVWDKKLEGFAVQVQPTGRKSYKVIYRMNSHLRWLTLGSVGRVDFDSARTLAAQTLLKVATGVDVQAEKAATRGTGTFEEVAQRYCNEYAIKNNKSWKQGDDLVRRRLIPRWGKLRAADITRNDVKLMLRDMKSPSVGAQTFKAASAIFNWAIEEEIGGIKINPCQGVDTAKGKARERVLAQSEIAKFWAAFDGAGFLESSALKLILLLGQRPGEIVHMHRSHIVDNWWQMPGEVIAELNWPGTKNSASHRVWLPKPAQAIIAELGDGLLFASPRRGVVELTGPMRRICAKLGLKGKGNTVVPHDLRRTHGTFVTSLGFGRDAMNRIQNHVDGGIASVYDRHSYTDENKRIMEAVAARIMQLVEGVSDNVVQFERNTA